MRTVLLRRGARVAAVTALAFATVLGGVATADGGHHDHAPKPIEVSIGASGIDAPESAPGGLAAFHVRTDDPKGRQLQLFRPHAGVSLDTVFADLTKAVSSKDPKRTAKGISAFTDEAEALGGAFVTPAVPETFTTSITAGRVVLLDFTAFFKDQAHPVFRTLNLRGGSDGDLAEFPDSIVITQETAAGPRFDVNGLHKAKDAILVHNASDELHEMQLQPVAPGTTDAKLKKFFDSAASGPPPFTGPALGLGAISHGRTALLRAHGLPPGTYALLCFIPDDKKGVPHAFEGMHKVVVLS
ncbi:hypothetical protein [Streptomyces sp. H27-D2]|uniref:hypothetical protein n=1 Tax=Streptomyces sp. H27-D2 TaxID=3046304 RepID=UPI002DBEB0A1|nr:hypothetical protein [Streptomyces sp. H27-D2]MEC4017827.1 hypothetical protein [Streptomyces sp. H27-D2]